MNDKIIGIIGGMGPEATAAFYLKIITSTKVTKDQDHFRVIIDSNPKIPDRTKAILGQGELPVDLIVQTGKNLEKMQVDVACIPCITSHYFIDEIQSKLSITILNALTELNNYINREYPNFNSIGILATTGTIEAGLFEKYLNNMNIIYPNNISQENLVMEAIYGYDGIKLGNHGSLPLNLLKKASEELIDKGAQVIILGCTEIGIVLKDHNVQVPIIDPMDVLAQSIIEWKDEY